MRDRTHIHPYPVYDSEEISNETLKDKKGKPSSRMKANGPETKNGIIVNCYNVRVRKEASFESDTLGLMHGGAKVTILGRVGKFYKISAAPRYKIGYITSEFVKEE